MESGQIFQDVPRLSIEKAALVQFPVIGKLLKAQHKASFGWSAWPQQPTRGSLVVASSTFRKSWMILSRISPPGQVAQAPGRTGAFSQRDRGNPPLRAARNADLADRPLRLRLSRKHYPRTTDSADQRRAVQPRRRSRPRPGTLRHLPQAGQILELRLLS